MGGKVTKHKRNVCDVLGQNAHYVALDKNDRLQVFTKPNDKVIREKIKKGWKLVGWIANDNLAELLIIVTRHYDKKVVNV
jgi:hypothetical protein